MSYVLRVMSNELKLVQEVQKYQPVELSERYAVGKRLLCLDVCAFYVCNDSFVTTI